MIGRNVGATCVNAMLHLNFALILYLDIRQGFAEGKAMDMMQTSKIYQFNTCLVGVTNDYKATANSDVVIVTSGNAKKTRYDKRGADWR